MRRIASLFRWPLSIDAVWLLMPLYVVAIRSLLQPIPMEDYWWHLVMGRLIDAQGAIPSANLFLFTLPADAPFYDQPWLAQWLMFWCAHHLGHVWTVLAHCTLLIAAWAALLVVAVSRGGSYVAVGVGAALAYYISASTLMPRTQMFAYPLFVVLMAALLWLAHSEPDTRRGAGVGLLLAVTTAFWANVHGSFVFAPVLATGVAAGCILESFRRDAAVDRRLFPMWGGVLLLVWGATAIAPGGLHNLMYPFKILLVTKGHSATVVEWTLANPFSLQGALFYLAMLASVVVLWRRFREVTFAEAAILAPTALIALSSVRGVLWWSLAAVAIVVPHFCAMRPAPERDEPGKLESTVNAALLLGFVATTLMALPGGPIFRAVDPSAIFGEGRLGDEGAAGVLSSMNPAVIMEKHVELLKGRRLFHHQGVGGLVEWRLTTGEDPKPVAFIDQRLELVPGELWDDYFVVSRTQPGWEAVVEKHRLDAFLVELNEQERLIEWLEASPAHELVAEDRMWRLYLERE